MMRRPLMSTQTTAASSNASWPKSWALGPLASRRRLPLRGKTRWSPLWMDRPMTERFPLLVYFSSVSGNTARFVEKLGLPRLRIPLYRNEPPLLVEAPYVLVTPTYGGGDGEGAVPKQVIRFLNDERNRQLLRGVIAAGNTNFGSAFCLAGDVIARKTGVPHLYRVELFGTDDDRDQVLKGLRTWWAQELRSSPSPNAAPDSINPERSRNV